MIIRFGRKDIIQRKCKVFGHFSTTAKSLLCPSGPIKSGLEIHVWRKSCGYNWCEIEPRKSCACYGIGAMGFFASFPFLRFPKFVLTDSNEFGYTRARKGLSLRSAAWYRRLVLRTIL